MKFCSKCGHANADGAVFCGGCGAPAAAPAQSMQAAPAQAAPPPIANKSPLWLVLNIICLVLFFPGSLVFNAIGIALAAVANSRYKAGDYGGSLSRTGNAKVMFILGLVFGVLGFAAFGVLGYYHVLDSWIPVSWLTPLV